MAKAATKTAAPKTTAPTGKNAEDLTEEQALRKRAGRTIGRGVWMTGYLAENPDASRDDIQIAWKEARSDFSKIGMRALKTLERAGMKVVVDPNLD